MRYITVEFKDQGLEVGYNIQPPNYEGGFLESPAYAEIEEITPTMDMTDEEWDELADLVYEAAEDEYYENSTC